MTARVSACVSRGVAVQNGNRSDIGSKHVAHGRDEGMSVRGFAVRCVVGCFAVVGCQGMNATPRQGSDDMSTRTSLVG
jgi:hypothetical protein